MLGKCHSLFFKHFTFRGDILLIFPILVSDVLSGTRVLSGLHENLVQVGLCLIVVQFEAGLANFIVNSEVSTTSLGLLYGTISLFTSPVVSAGGVVKAPLHGLSNGISFSEEVVAGDVLIQ